jgi:hypothetical protein
MSSALSTLDQDICVYKINLFEESMFGLRWSFCRKNEIFLWNLSQGRFFRNCLKFLFGFGFLIGFSWSAEMMHM